MSSLDRPIQDSIQSSIQDPLPRTLQSPLRSPLERLKVLINSSTPIIVMETVEEVCAMSLVRTACSQLSLPVFEWTIADGLVRCGTEVAVPQPVQVAQARVE